MRATLTRLVSLLGVISKSMVLTLALASCGGDGTTGPSLPQGSQLGVIVQPTSVASGATFTVQVAVQTDQGVTVTTATPRIVLFLQSGTGSGSLGGTLSQDAVNGVATFSVTLDKIGTSYVLIADASGASLRSAQSSAIAVTPGAPAKLVMTTQPTSVASQVVVGPAVRVTVQDAAGNTATDATTSVTISLTSGAGSSGAVLGGTVTQAAVAGIATFNNLTVDKVGAGYTLTATASALTSTTSGVFAVTPAAAAKLAFAVQPTGAASGATISPAMQVVVQDAGGNTVTNAVKSITLAITTGTGTTAATLGGTLTLNTVNGVATFNSVTIDRIGAGYTLTATATSLTGATSSTFAVTAGAAAKLAFAVQPTDGGTGTVISPAVQIAVQDAGGNTVPTATNNVTIGITSGTGTTGAALGGTVTVAAVNGIATFNSLTVDKAGTSYTLVATSGTLTSSTSSAFAVTAGAAVTLAFAVQPTDAASSAAISPAVQVAVQDASGNTVSTATTSITVAITSGSGATGATLGGTVTVAAVNGIATFNSLTVDKVGTGYTLTATASTLTSTTSGAFAVTPGAAAKLAFAVQPTGVASGATISPAMQVVVQDAGGNTVTNAVTSITLAITTGTGTTAATLGGTLTLNTVSGVATFSNVTIDKIGTGYTLTATATSLTSATSSTIAVTAGAAMKLSFTVQPTSVVTGAVISPAVQITVKDAGGNTVPTATNNVTIGITSGTGTTGAALGGTVTVAAVNGIATFNSLTVDKVGTGYTLVATSSGLTSSTSSAFAVAVGAASALTFTVQPPSAPTVGAVLSPALQVSVRDAGGNTVTTATTSITVALLNNTAGAILGGTTTVSAVNGVATFSTLTLDKPGQGFTLQATATSLTSATSTAFIAIGPATKLVFTAQPTSAVRNAAIAPSIVVAVQDAAGNVVNASTSVTIAIGTNAGSGTLSGTLTRSASAGLATFNDLSIDAAGSGYTLAASAASVTSATSSTFNIAAFGTATKVGFIVQPSNADVTTVISPAVQVAVLDASGNTVTTSSASVTLAFGANPGGGTLGGTLTASAVSGVATFSTLTVSAAGTAYTLVGSSGSLTSATSTAFNVVNPNAAIKLGFVQQPTSTTAGSTLVPAVTVAIQNSSGATVTTDNTTLVSITVATGPAGGTIRGTLSVTVTNGVATFSALSDTVAGTYTLRASAGGLTSATSTSYVISAGVASKLLFLTQPANTIAGQLFPSTVRVGVADAFGNTVPSATNSVTIRDYVGPCCDEGSVLRAYLSPSPALGGTLTVAAVSGIASFTDLRPRFAKEANYNGLVASAIGITDTRNSALFTVTPSAPARVWANVPNPNTCNPCNAGTQTANLGFAVSAFVLDSLDNLVGAGSNVISLAIGSNPSSGTLTAQSNVAATNGKADFNVSIDKAGNGYTIVASTAGLSSVPSYPFNVAAFGTASRVGFTVQPTNAAVGASISPAVKACVQDGVGNTVTTATNNITIAIGTNPGSATLGGTLTAAAVSGCATFASLTLSAAGSGYTITASATSLTTAISSPFNITP